MGLIFFEGGPLDQHAYETSVLLGEEALTLPILEYLWTSETKKSERTGNVAQIWRHKSIIGDSPTSTVSPAAVAALASQEYEQQVVAAVPPPAPAPAPVQQIRVPQPEPVAAAMTGVAGPEDETRIDVQSTVTAPVAQSDGASGTADRLLERRKALKLSRSQVAEGTGLAVSKVINIENGTGSRVKDEERQTLADFIARCEQGSVGSVAGAHA